MRYLFRTFIGLGLLTAAITAEAYGIAQFFEIGDCGTDRYGRTVGPPCPSGTGALIVVMVLGAFMGIFGAGMYANRGKPGSSQKSGLGMGIAIGQLRFWAATLFAGGAAVAVGLMDLDENEFRPGMEIVAIGGGSVLLTQILGFLMFGRDDRKGRSVPGIPGTVSGPPQAPPRGNIPLPPPPSAEALFPPMQALRQPPPVAPQPPPVSPLPPPVTPPVAPSPEPAAEGGFAGLGTDSVAQSGLGGAESPAYAEPLANADLYAKLDQLADLHRSGALTEEQYEAARAKVMDQL